ncbi:TPA: hypothetical protein ACUY58_000815 [Legionella pneumophila]
MNINWTINSPENYFEEGKLLNPNISDKSIGGDIAFIIWSQPLKYMIDFGDTQIDDLDKHRAIRDTLIEIYKSKDITAASFLDKLQLNLKSIRQRPQENKYLMSSISIDFPSIFNEIKIFDSTIKLITSFSDDSPVKKKYDEQEYTYTGIIVHNRTNSNDIKYHLENLNLFRAFLCYYTNPSMIISFDNDDKLKPINSIRLSNNLVLLDEKGGVIDKDTNFYNNYTLSSNFKLKSEDKNIINECNSFFEKIEQCKYKQLIKESLLIFVNSLDELDQDVAFVLFWNCLDKLSNSSKGNYDAVLERVSNLYSNPSYHKIVLENLKNIRNNFAHHGTRCKDAKHFCYILQSYYFHLLDFHLKNIHEFHCIEDAFQVLSYLSKQEYRNKMDTLLNKLQLRKPRAII